MIFALPVLAGIILAIFGAINALSQGEISPTTMVVLTFGAALISAPAMKRISLSRDGFNFEPSDHSATPVSNNEGRSIAKANGG